MQTKYLVEISDSTPKTHNFAIDSVKNAHTANQNSVLSGHDIVHCKTQTSVHVRQPLKSLPGASSSGLNDESMHRVLRASSTERVRHSEDQYHNPNEVLWTNLAVCSDGIRRHLYNCLEDGKCLICGFVTSANRNDTAKKHLFIHVETREFVCDICKAAFKSHSGLLSHKESHTDVKLYECKVCKKTFKTRSCMRIHAKRHSDVKKSLNCPICQKVLAHSTSLRSHMLIHTGEKPYSCSTCSKSFSNKKKLNDHSYTHESEKRYKCDVCDKGFNARPNLKQHKLMHTGEKKHKCDICDKTFTFYTNLKQHMVTHSAVRKYKCETCGMKFKFPHHLRQHLDSHQNRGDF